MVIDIAVIVFILAIAFYQAIQGTFSSLIMAILTILCAVAALNFYEPLAAALNNRLWAYAPSVALLALFAIPLLVLRTLFDRLIRGNVLLGLWPDRIAGGVFGLITATVLMGMFVLIVMMLPMPGSFLTYHPYNASLEVENGGGARKAANFVLALARHMSAGPLAPVNRQPGNETFGDAHDDLYLESFCLRSRPTGARASTPADALQVRRTFRLIEPDADEWKQYVEKLKENGTSDTAIKTLRGKLASLYEQAPKYPLISALTGTRLYVVRLAVDELARNEKDDWYRLPATHFRLVTDTHHSYWPVGYLTYAGRWRVETGGADLDKAKPGDVWVARPWKREGGPKKLQVDWVYRLPVEEKPREIIFRRVARASVRTPIDGLPEPFASQGQAAALTVVPVENSADFNEPSSARVIRPVKLDSRRGMFRPFQFRIRKGGGALPDIFAQASMNGNFFNSGVVAATRAEINAHKVEDGDNIYNFRPPRAGRRHLVQLYCRTDGDYPSARNAADMLAQLNPELILSDGRRIGHCGGYVSYGTEPNDAIFLYYEPENDQKLQVDLSRFRKVLADHRTEVPEKEGLGFVFLVRSDEESVIVGASMGKNMGRDYDFYTEKPVNIKK